MGSKQKQIQSSLVSCCQRNGISHRLPAVSLVCLWVAVLLEEIDKEEGKEEGQAHYIVYSAWL